MFFCVLPGQEKEKKLVWVEEKDLFIIIESHCGRGGGRDGEVAPPVYAKWERGGETERFCNGETRFSPSLMSKRETTVFLALYIVNLNQLVGS